MITLQVDHLTHRYRSVSVFENLSFSLHQGNILGCIGRNGIGKSTLLRIIAGLLVPSAGTVTLTCAGQSSTDLFWRRGHCGFCAPYVQLYDELTIAEHLAFHRMCRPYSCDHVTEELLLNQAGLDRYRSTCLGELSSGTKQRFKLMLAFWGTPPLIILDEPTTNLDTAGIEVLSRWVERSAEHSIIILATNVPTEQPWCTDYLDLEAQSFFHASSNRRARTDHE